MILSSAIRRLAAVAGVATAGLAGAALVPAPASPLPTVTVYKSPTCGCCTKWIAHLRSAGFTVVAHDTDDLNGVQSTFGVPFRLGSCHTAKVGKYVIEGHVPADLIQKLLTEQPRVVGPVPGGRVPLAGNAMGLLEGKVITVYSPKGGTGCTTVAVNLAIALHNEDTRVVIVDANLQFGDVAMFFNEQGKNTILEIAPRVDDLDPETVEEIMVKHEASGIHILAAPQRPEQAEKLSTQQFSAVVNYLRQMYSYVVVDTSSILTDIILAAVDLSDVVVLVTTQDIPAIKNARLFLDLLQTIQAELLCTNGELHRIPRRFARAHRPQPHFDGAVD